MSANTISLDDAWARMKDGSAVYIDVRSTAEFAAGHPAGAWNVPLIERTARGQSLNHDFVASIRAIAAGNGDPALIVGCQVGGRSRQACQLLAAEGVGKLHDFAAGWAGRKHPFGGPGLPGWATSEYPKATEAEPGRSWAAIRELVNG